MTFTSVITHNSKIVISCSDQYRSNLDIRKKKERNCCLFFLFSDLNNKSKREINNETRLSHVDEEDHQGDSWVPSEKKAFEQMFDMDTKQFQRKVEKAFNEPW